MAHNEHHLNQVYHNIMQGNALLYKYQFLVEFVGSAELGQYTQFSLQPSDTSTNITYWAQSASIPSFELSKGKTNFFGTEFRAPGVLKFSHSWKVNFLCDQGMNLYQMMTEWRKKISDLKLDGGGIKKVPDVSMRISLINADHSVKTTSFVVAGVWPKNIGAISMQYANGGGAATKFDVDFAFQYCYEDANFDTSTNPMNA